MSESEKSIRAQLNEAIERVRRELQILQAPSSIGAPPDNASVIAGLEQELRDLLAARADLYAIAHSPHGWFDPPLMLSAVRLLSECPGSGGKPTSVPGARF